MLTLTDNHGSLSSKDYGWCFGYGKNIAGRILTANMCKPDAWYVKELFGNDEYRYRMPEGKEGFATQDEAIAWAKKLHDAGPMPYSDSEAKEKLAKLWREHGGTSSGAAIEERVASAMTKWGVENGLIVKPKTEDEKKAEDIESKRDALARGTVNKSWAADVKAYDEAKAKKAGTGATGGNDALAQAILKQSESAAEDRKAMMTILSAQQKATSEQQTVLLAIVQNMLAQKQIEPKPTPTPVKTTAQKLAEAKAAAELRQQKEREELKAKHARDLATELQMIKNAPLVESTPAIDAEDAVANKLKEICEENIVTG
jgi:hypothetical protein